MKANTELNLKIKKVSYIVIAWLVLSLFQVGYDYLIVISYTNNPELFRLPAVLVSTFIISIIAGILGGLFIINKVEPWLRRLPFWKALVYLFGFYSIAGFSLIALGSLIFQCIILQSNPFDNTVQTEVFKFITGLDFIKLFITWGIIFLGTIICLMIYDKYGPGNFRNLLLGRYFHPRIEERVFMFLDIRSSTTIAEKIGDQKYFQFFHDFINDATEPILYTKGEIYQYVGDEIVVSWTLDNGVEEANCVRCFFEVQNSIRKNKKHYLKKYGQLPEFKAGLHFGQVVSGEIGVVKKEIAYSGDVLNTTNRIQSECNKHQLDFLISNDLLQLLNLPENYKAKSIGPIQLRGKTEDMELSTIEQSSNSK